MPSIVHAPNMRYMLGSVHRGSQGSLTQRAAHAGHGGRGARRDTYGPSRAIDASAGEPLGLAWYEQNRTKSFIIYVFHDSRYCRPRPTGVRTQPTAH